LTQSFLIVDDSRAIQAIIKRSISAAGYESASVQSASNGQAALEALERMTPDLLITDWHMPGMSGLELIQVVKQTRGDQIQMGLVTTEVSPDMLRQARDSGAAFILQKPFNDAELLESIRRIVGPPRQGNPATPPAPAPARPQAAAVATDQEADELASAIQAAGGNEAAALADNDTMLAHLVRSLGEMVRQVPFRLVESNLPAIDKLSNKVLLCLYASDQRPGHALGLMDAQAVCMLGAASNGLTPAVAKPLVLMADPARPTVDQAIAFMRQAITAMHPDSLSKPALSAGNMVPRSMGKLSSALEKNQCVRAYKLTIPGYGEGRIAFVLL
jgi:CheY-like chemotaxis protein